MKLEVGISVYHSGSFQRLAFQSFGIFEVDVNQVDGLQAEGFAHSHKVLSSVQHFSCFRTSRCTCRVVHGHVPVQEILFFPFIIITAATNNGGIQNSVEVFFQFETRSNVHGLQLLEKQLAGVRNADRRHGSTRLAVVTPNCSIN